MTPKYDIVIIGAGLSGINAAYRLQTMMPDCSFVLLEARQCLGGTWSFWSYPGIRSDSNMALFSFPWHPWPYDVALAPAKLINTYLEDAARTQGIFEKVQFRHRVTAVNWDSSAQEWTLDVAVSPEHTQAGDGVTTSGNGSGGSSAPALPTQKIKAWFILNCSGYYTYDKARATTIPGLDSFDGPVLHPQFWPASTSLANKRVVLIGSGATAVTMLPALVNDTQPPPAKVTLLQRSPSYVFMLPPRVDFLTRLLRRLLPALWAARLAWLRQLLKELLQISFVLAFPRAGRAMLVGNARARLPKGFDVDKHFNPSYDPFEQRVCASAGGDFFDALSRGPETCEIVTDTIDTVAAHAVRTTSGLEIPADAIITATGLYLRLFGAFAVSVDGTPWQPEQVCERYVWNAVMIEGLPNVGSIMGYLAGSWTPGADVRTRVLIAIMKRMRRARLGAATPYIDPVERQRLPRKPALPNSSTYVVEGRSRMPLVADVGPWRARKNWLQDWLFLRFGNKNEGLRFTPEAKAK